MKKGCYSPSNLDGGRPDGPGSAVHEDRLSGLGLCAHDERLVRREVGRAEGGALREAQPLVQREDVRGLADEELGVRARVPAGGEDPLPNLQIKLYIFIYLSKYILFILFNTFRSATADPTAWTKPAASPPGV